MFELGAGKASYILRDMLNDTGGPVWRAGAEGFNQAFNSVFKTLVIHGFRGTIGVEQNAVASLHHKTQIGANSIEDLPAVNPEGHAFRA